MKKLAILLTILSTPAFAQQQDPTEFLQKALTSLQTQRNAALDNQAGAEARLSIATDKISKLEAELKALKEAAPKDVAPKADPHVSNPAAKPE